MRTLRDIARNISEGRQQIASEKLYELSVDVSDRKDPFSDQVRIFASAMAQKLSNEVSNRANLYLSDHGVSQIQLFDLLSSKVPLVQLSRKVVNSILVEICRNTNNITLIDIGIGSGTQEVSFLQELKNQLIYDVRQCTIVGIECQSQSLTVAEQAIGKAASRTGIDLNFIKFPIPIEGMTASDWKRIGNLAGRKIALSSFALHHVQGNSGESREQVFSCLADLRVNGLILAEPNSDHFNTDYVVRFEEAWRHFGATFAMLDQLDLTENEKRLLKATFFGREIQDILGMPDSNRSELHERTCDWWKRLKKAGFVPLHFNWPLPREKDQILKAFIDEDHVNIAYDGVGIVSVICARPQEMSKAVEDTCCA